MDELRSLDLVELVRIHMAGQGTILLFAGLIVGFLRARILAFVIAAMFAITVLTIAGVITPAKVPVVAWVIGTLLVVPGMVELVLLLVLSEETASQVFAGFLKAMLFVPFLLLLWPLKKLKSIGLLKSTSGGA